MGRVVDQQVVEMRFDNGQFERGVEQSTKSIDKLKNSLDFSGLSNGIDGLGNSVSSISDKLSPFGEAWRRIWSDVGDIAFSTISTITNAINALGIDQVFAGFSKYSQITKSTQTMMAATRHEWEDTRAQMDYVNEQLLKLAWFTDETSYSFTEMVNTVGKFTSSGIAPDDAVTTMMGIATWGGIAGASIEEVNRVYYNMAQAVSSGAIRVIDWNSVETANMNVRELEQLFIDTAVKLGTLQRNEEGYTYAIKETKNGVEELTVSVDNFRNTLNKDYGLWFTKDVFVEAMKYMGNFEEAMYAHLNVIGETYDLSTTEMISYVDDYVELTKKITDVTEVGMRKLSTLGKDMPSITADLFADYLDDGEINDYAKAMETLAEAYGLTTGAFEDAVNEYYELEDYDESLDELAKTYGLTAEKLTEMYEAYDKIDSYSGTLEKLAADYGLTTDELKNFFEQYRGTMFDLDYLTTMMGGNEEAARALQAALKDLSREEYELGRTAMKASQESRTFQDSFQATQDALSTKWMMIFQTVLGDYLQSVELWSTVTDEMWHLFVENIENLYDAIAEFGELGGRDILLEGVANVWENIRATIDAIQGGFQDIFPMVTGEGLIELTEKFRDFTESLAFSDLQLLQIRTTMSYISETAKNIWGTIKTIFDAVLKAFSDIFPKQKDATQIIYELARGIRNLSLRVKEFVENNAEKFRSVFRGIFAVVDIVRQLLVAIISPFTGLTDKAGGLAEGILDVSASFGDWLTKVDKYIKENDVFGKAVQGIIDFFASLRDGIDQVVKALTGKDLGEIWATITDNSGQAFNSIKEFFGIFNNGDADGAEKKTSGLARIFETLNGWIVSIKEAWAEAQPYFDEFTNNLSDTFDINVHSWEEVQQAIREAGAIGVLFMIIQTIYQLYHEITWFFSSLPKILHEFTANINLMIESLSETMWGLRNKLYAGIIKDIARALLEVAIAVAIIATIKPAKLHQAIGAIILLFGELAGLLTMIMKMQTGNDWKAIWSFGSAMKKFGWVLLMAAGAIWIITKSTDDPKELWNAVGALAAIFAMIAALIVGMTKLNIDKSKLSTLAASMVALGIALILFSAAIAIIVQSGKNDPEMVEKAVLALLAMLVVIGLLMSQASRVNAGKVLTLSAALIIIGIALVIIAGAIAIVANAVPNPETLFDVVGALGAFLAIIGVLMYAANNIKVSKAIGAAFALILVGAALLIIAEAISVVANSPMESMQKTIVSIVSVLIVVALILVALSQVSGDMLSGAAALLVAAIGIIALAYALTMLDQIGDPAAVLLTLGIALIILLAAGFAAQYIAPGLYALGIALALIGAGALMAGIGFLKFSEGIEKIVALGTEGIDVWNYFIESLGELLPMLIAQFVEGCVVGFGIICAAIIDSADIMLEALFALIETLLKAIIRAFPLIKEIFYQLFYMVIDMVKTTTPIITETALFLLKDTLERLNAYIGDITYYATSILLEILFGTLNALIDHIPDFIQTGIDFVIGLLDGLSQGIEDNHERFFEAVERLCNAIKDAFCDFFHISSPSKVSLDWAKSIMDGIINGFVDIEKLKEIGNKIKELGELIMEKLRGFIDKVKEIGGDIMKGLKEGIEEFMDDPIGAMGEACTGIVDLASGIFETHSPSKVFERMGKYLDEGLAWGIEKNIPLITDATDDMSNSAIDGMSEAIAMITETIDEDMDTEPTITPVLDLSNVSSGLTEMDGMFASSRAFSLAGDNSGLVNGKISRENAWSMSLLDLKDQLGKNKGEKGSFVQNNTFNVTGNNPKEIANQISTILQNQVERKDAVWA